MRPLKWRKRLRVDDGCGRKSTVRPAPDRQTETQHGKDGGSGAEVYIHVRGRTGMVAQINAGSLSATRARRTM